MRVRRIECLCAVAILALTTSAFGQLRSFMLPAGADPTAVPGGAISTTVELSPGGEGDRERVESELIDQLRLKTNLRYRLEFHDYGTLPRYDVKAKRFKDLRKDH